MNYVLKIDKNETRDIGKIDFNRLKDYEVIAPDFDKGYELVGGRDENRMYKINLKDMITLTLRQHTHVYGVNIQSIIV